MSLFTADFETTTDENDCRVWAWGVCEIGNEENFQYGNTIESFFQFLQESENMTLYFHNAKFDGEFIMCYLFENGYVFTDNKHEKTKSFTALISDTGQFYSMKIIFEKGNKKSKYVQFYDSLKIIPFSVEAVAESFGLEESKLEIDYKAKREKNHQLSTDEIEYLKNDVVIMAKALHILFKQKLTKMTQASNALYDYKNVVTEKNFKRWFPTPEADEDIRQSYKGGFTYLNPRYKGVDVGEGIVLDVNSLYPWVMKAKMLPYGEGLFFTGKYEPDELYPLYVQMITCEFELKKGYIPTIQIKHNLAFVPNEYLESSNGEEVTLCLTSVDLELFLEHYEVYNIVYHSGWKFKATIGLFSDYIDKWIKIKNESTIKENKGMRTLSKLMLNALYGKFGLNPNVCSKIPYYEDGLVKYRNGEKETRAPLYIPVATFITAWARHKTITSAQKMYDKFVYADTDSLHLLVDLPESIKQMSNKEFSKMTTADLQKHGIDFPSDFEINPVDLGAWKCESKFNRARFIRQKCYVEDWNTPETWNTDEYQHELLNITCAGMPERCYKNVNWNNFHVGSTFEGKLQPKHVKGGIVLVDVEFTIKP